MEKTITTDIESLLLRAKEDGLEREITELAEHYLKLGYSMNQAYLYAASEWDIV